MKRVVAVMVLLCAMLALPARAQTRAWLERTEIHEGEVVAFTIETDQALQQVDVAPLRAQFDIGGQRVQRRYTLVNGQGRATTVFSIGLRPRSTGVLTVPALRVGSAQTAPLQLRVTPAAVQRVDAASDVFVETVVDTRQPYVQQAVGVTVRLNFAVPLLSGQLDLAPPANASLRQVGDDATFSRALGGRRYNVVERHYMLIPERSGALVLAGARFNGLAGEGDLDAPLFDTPRRALSAAAPVTPIQVLPIPANAPQPWLPLHDFKLRYVGTPTSAVAGQAVRVSVEASADGASAAQLPAIELPVAPGVQVFAEPAQLEERFDAGRPQTVVRRTFSLLASQAGALHVPGPRVQWWDAVQGVARTTALPALQLQVAAGMAASMAGPADSHDANANANAHADASAATSHAPAAASAPSAPPLPARWRSGRVWGLLVLLALAISMVLAWRWQRGRRGFHLRKPSPPLPPSPQALQQTLQLALQQGDFAGITQALCALAGDDAHGPLDAVLARLEAGPQREAVQQLQAARWGGGNAQAALAALRSAFNTGPRWCKPKRPEASLLPPLYPE